MYASKIADMLTANGFPVIPERTTEPSPERLGQVVVNAQVYVVVSFEGHAVVSVDADYAHTYYAECYTDKRLMTDVQDALDKNLPVAQQYGVCGDEYTNEF